MPSNKTRLPRPNAQPRTLAAVLLLVLLLTACPATSGLRVELGAEDAEVVRGGQAQVEVELIRIGVSSDVTLGVTGLPDNVTASFAPATLSGGTLTSTLTFTAAPDAVNGTYTVTVSAQGGGLQNTAELELEVVGLTVDGTVTALFDQPVSGLNVESQGKTDVTAADGSFTLTDLSLPYDLTVYDSIDQWAHVYHGLTHASPKVSPNYAFTGPPSGTPRGAILTGDLSGDSIPVPAGQVVRVCAAGLDGFVLGCDSVDPGESTYTLPVEWLDDDTRHVGIHALQVEYGLSGLPASYPGYYSQELTLTHLVDVDLPLDLGSALDTVTLGLSSDSPDVAFFFGAIDLVAELSIPLFSYSVGETSLDVNVPELPGVSLSFVAGTGGPRLSWVSGLQALVGEHELKVPEPTELLSPADLETGVTTATAFSASGGAKGPLTFLWQPDASGRWYALTTMEETVTIPDLSSIGLALPSGTDYRWQVLSSGGTSVEDGLDAFLDYFRFLLLSGGSPGLEDSGSLSFSTAREFTTAP